MGNGDFKEGKREKEEVFLNLSPFPLSLSPS
jgi:hypothetical protein